MNIFCVVCRNNPLSMQSPEKLTISCILSIISSDDVKLLENKIWDNMSNVWLAVDSFTATQEKVIVRASTEEEAMFKLYEKDFFGADALVHCFRFSDDIEQWMEEYCGERTSIIPTFDYIKAVRERVTDDDIVQAIRRYFEDYKDMASFIKLSKVKIYE